MAKKVVKKGAIKALSSEKTKSDPISSPIVRREKDVNKDIIQDWVPYFENSNNIYPNDLAKRARRASMHSAILQKKVTFTCGKDFIYKVDGEVTAFEDLDQNLQDFIKEVNNEGDSLRDLFKMLATNYIYIGNTYLQIAKSGDETGLFSEDATKVRIGKNKENAYISSYWTDIKNSSHPDSKYNIVSVPLFQGDYETSAKNYIIHLKRKYLGFDYYGLPDYVSALDWIDIEYRIPKFNIDKFDNAFMPSALVSQYGEPPDGLTPQQYVDKIKDNLTGEGNNSKVSVQLLDSPEQKADIYEFSQERDGEFGDLNELAKKAITSAHRISPTLAGLETAGRLGQDNKVKEEYDKFMNEVCIPDFQEPLLRLLNKTINKIVGFENLEIGILNLPPVNNSEKVDLNAVLTINEGRNLLGYDPLEVGGDEIINNNSVENIDEDVDSMEEDTNEETEE